MHIVFFLLLILTSIVDIVFSIACYQCSSVNGSDPSCEDLFQGDTAESVSLLQSPCLTSLRGRLGLFPATHCIKLIAYSREPNTIQYVYRTCSRDEGNDDSITRTSHCGYVKLNWINRYKRFRGCLHICDKDACNRASTYSVARWRTMFSLGLFSLQRLL